MYIYICIYIYIYIHRERENQIDISCINQGEGIPRFPGQGTKVKRSPQLRPSPNLGGHSASKNDENSIPFKVDEQWELVT